MRTIVITLAISLFTGCASLIVRSDDSLGKKVAKVATRAVLILPTGFWSENFIMDAKMEERGIYYQPSAAYLGYGIQQAANSFSNEMQRQQQINNQNQQRLDQINDQYIQNFNNLNNTWELREQLQQINQNLKDLKQK